MGPAAAARARSASDALLDQVVSAHHAQDTQDTQKTHDARNALNTHNQGDAHDTHDAQDQGAAQHAHNARTTGKRKGGQARSDVKRAKNLSLDERTIRRIERLRAAPELFKDHLPTQSDVVSEAVLRLAEQLNVKI